MNWSMRQIFKKADFDGEYKKEVKLICKKKKRIWLNVLRNEEGKKQNIGQKKSRRKITKLSLTVSFEY